MQVYAQAFTLLPNTGLRSGELCNITWNDIDVDSGLIRIRPKKGWTPKSCSREFFLNDAGLSDSPRCLQKPFDENARFRYIETDEMKDAGECNEAFDPILYLYSLGNKHRHRHHVLSEFKLGKIDLT